jgi:hypothetical protein
VSILKNNLVAEFHAYGFTPIISSVRIELS